MAKRTVDKRKTAKALRKLRKAAERATGADGPGLTNWEKDFVEGVSGRLEKYGSAFRDPGKGRLDDALSQRQAHVARVIDKKSRKGKAMNKDEAKGPPKQEGLRRSSFKRKTPMGGAYTPRVRDINEDPPDPPEPELTPEQKRAALHLVPGGKSTGKKR
ncbi:MAG: hypothetical protein Q8R02_04575 [Hyphomonadaceae bacterium]|nr:hypothetical protein [Hyphomonadaceae bacterium]